MQVTFLEATNGIALSKKHSIQNGFTPYPHVKKVTSHEHVIPNDSAGLAMFERHLIDHGESGHCMMKGKLKRKIENESRAGKTDRVAYSDLLVLDVDGLKLPGWDKPLNKLTSTDVKLLAKLVMRELPLAFQNVSYIAQASASLGLKGDKASLHIFIFLTYAMPAKAIKLWLQHANFESELFASQLDLSSNGHSLKYPLDVSVADNSKLIFCAPPTFEDGTHDPFSSSAERIVRVSNDEETLDLAKLLNEVSPELVHQKNNEHKNRLRAALGFHAKKEKLTIATVNNKSEEILQNPDRMSITVHDASHGTFVHCNVNGGDSNAYYFRLNDPTYMYNFKGEPIWSIEKADPDFYASVFDQFEKEISADGRASYPVAMRDYYTDTYYNGVFDPNLNQFSPDFPLLPCSPSSIEGFMRSHGRAKPDFVPDAQVMFDPTSNANAVNLKTVPYHINMFRRTKYMLADNEHESLGVGDAQKIGDACPLIFKLMTHMLGGQTLEVEHFINWLASIFQTKKKTKTSWVLQGVPGTGKGIFYTEVLRPLFGSEHVPMRALQNIEEQFNLYMRQALFLVVDEFHMASASSGTVRIADKLKSAITENTITIRAMRSNGIELPNYTNFIFLTNRMDAIKIEEGDRRYNIAPRQEKKLEHVYPEVIDCINDIKNELHTFAAILSNYVVSDKLVANPIANNAKSQMAQVTMSVMEEFFAAVRHGDVSFFSEILDISINNVMQAQEIITAQRFVKQWIAETKWPYSVLPMEHLRVVYGVLTDNRMSQREFIKAAERNGLTRQRKREHTADRNDSLVKGVVVDWAIDNDQFKELTDKYFNADDQKLLEAV